MSRTLAETAELSIATDAWARSSILAILKAEGLVRFTDGSLFLATRKDDTIADEVFARQGYIRYHIEPAGAEETFALAYGQLRRAAGDLHTTSLFAKGNKIVMFTGWESNTMCSTTFYSHYLVAEDVTNLIHAAIDVQDVGIDELEAAGDILDKILDKSSGSGIMPERR
jgi:hypothetical protein